MANLFISYARIDGKALAERLEGDLRGHQHAPWRDRAEIEGGDDWSREIEEAIDGCDGVLALLTQGAFDSWICRCEHERALRKQKYVVPLLVQKDADRPLYLEAAHYLDFTDPANYDAALSELLKSIDGERGVRQQDLPERARRRLPEEVRVRSMAAALLGRQASWDDVVALADRQRARFLDAIAARSGAVGLYEPSLYVRRAAEEGELEEFLEGEASALVLLGDMGIGKTNLLCHWSGAQAEKRNAVFLYAGDRLRAPELESELTKDLNLGDPAALEPALKYLNRLAGENGQRMLIVLDALNDFRGGKGDGQRRLLASTDALVARLPGQNIRVLLSCSTPAWNRLDRIGRPTMSGARYHRRGQPLVLGAFTEEEAAGAFERYRARFELPFGRAELPPALAARTRSPLILRLLADAYQPAAGQAGKLQRPDTLIFRRYYEERLRRLDDQRFVQALVDEMYQREDAALPLTSLLAHPVLGPAIADEQGDNSYARLLDDGVLLEVKGEGLFMPDLLKFTYPLVGAYALAVSLAQRREPPEALLQALLAKAGSFPLAWDAAVTLLVMKTLADKSSHALFEQFAGSPEAAHRELASDGLVRLDEVRRERATQILEALLASHSAYRQRTALRAAFRIGPPARDLLLRGAMSTSQPLRRAVRDTLYVIWIGSSDAPRLHARATLYSVWWHAPDFAHELVKFLVARISWSRPRQLWRITRFVIDWCITMYINHCDNEEVARQTAEVLYDLAVNGLHLDRVNLGRHADRMVASAVAAVFSRPLLEWMLQATPEEADAFFRRPAEERALLARLAPLVDPKADLLQHEALLSSAFRSGVDLYCGAAALAVGVHAFGDFVRCEAALRAMFDALDRPGRIWLLMSFAVLLGRTPSAWTGLLEHMTRRCLEDRFAPGGAKLPKVARFTLAPLGLAYGKRGEDMPFFRALVERAAAGGDDAHHAEILSMLAQVGFYYPEPVLGLLRPHLAALAARAALREALAHVLATMRTLHFDFVDVFIEQAGLDEVLRRQVAATTDVALIDEFMRTLGLFNNAVNQCLFHPRMRQGLSVFALESCARASSAQQFIVAYAEQAMRMARGARFRLLEWRSAEPHA